MLFDSKYGGAKCVLQDNGYLTDLRTAAAGALAAKKIFDGAGAWAKEKVQLCVIGSGIQAMMQVLVIKEVVSINLKVKCWTRTKANGIKVVDDMAKLGVTIILSDTVGEAINDSSPIVTTTL